MLNGVNFDLIPSNAVGIVASDNNNPLQNRDAESGDRLYSIVEKTSNTMRMVLRATSSHVLNVYLGAIVSSDRETVYWVNNTKPLP